MSDPILSLYDTQSTENFYKYWDKNKPIGKNLMQIFTDKIFNLEYPEIVVSYAMLSYRITRSVPILILYGKEGTGKSTVLDIICHLRGIDKPFACGQSTYASLRNYVQNQKINAETGEFIEGCCCLLDNLHSSHLSIGDNLYNFLLTGYDRKTSKVSIASEKRGENIDFDTYCPKVISTIHPVHLDSSLSELQRRLIVIEFRKWGELFQSVCKNYSLLGLDNLYKKFWSEGKYSEFVALRKELDEKIITTKVSEKLKPKYDLLADLITNGLVIGLFDSFETVLDYFSDYAEKTYSEFSILEQHIGVYLQTLMDSRTVYLKPFKSYIDGLRQNGVIDPDISFKRIKEITITKFDYKLTFKGLEKNEPKI